MNQPLDWPTRGDSGKSRPHRIIDKTMRLQHPHDHFVREFFSEPAHAWEFLSAVLPAALADTLDWARLRGEPATLRMFLAALDSARSPDPNRLAGVLRLAD